MREGSIQQVVRSLDLLRQQHLAPDPTNGFGAREVVPFSQTGDLSFAVGSDHDGLIDAFVDVGFEEQGHIVNYDGLRVFLCSLLREPRLFARDAGMNDPF